MTPAGLRLLAGPASVGLHDPPTPLPQRNSEVHAETSMATTYSTAIA